MTRVRLLTLPALLFVLVLFLVPAAILFSYSVLNQAPSGRIAPPFTLANYAHLFTTPVYRNVLFATLRVSAATAALSVVLGFPVALTIVRGGPIVSRVTMIILVAPLVVSVVVRTYGWQLLLANGATGVVNWTLHAIGFSPAPVRVLFSETAVVIGSLHVYLPMMVLPLSSAIARIQPGLEEAARTLGAPGWRVFWRVTLPLSLPGLIAGLTIVFSLTCASYVTPAILGGNRGQMLGNLLEQQVVTVYNWPLSAAIAVVMVGLSLSVSVVLVRLLERPMRRLRRIAEAA